MPSRKSPLLAKLAQEGAQALNKKVPMSANLGAVHRVFVQDLASLLEVTVPIYGAKELLAAWRPICQTL